MTTINRLDYRQLSDDYNRIEAALEYLQAHHRSQPSLSDVAGGIGLSEYHFQRVFTRWVGISPKRFLQYVTKEHARYLLDNAVPVMEAAYEAGLSGPGRLHDLFVNFEAATPGEYKQQGLGLVIRYGFQPTPFGTCLLALTERGLCGLAFAPAGRETAVFADLQRRWRRATWVQDEPAVAPLVDRIFPGIGVQTSHEPLSLYVGGTNFQVKVWEALLRIPPGSVTTYQNIAASIGMPGAVRAVGQAVGANPIAFLIPCHRVIRKLGVLGGYHWGLARKQAILGWEQARRESMYLEAAV